MYQINPETNRIQPIQKKTFTELQIQERAHLQEWLANEPSAMGEDLLIIQKEFSGFEGTQERLDLLALDTGGRLAIIENKLDDSGRDVIWQALKYAAYCSTLKTDQIIDIFHSYLAKGTREDAAETIADFMEDTSAEDLVLNPASSQRIILVAAWFRKEVTSTALWLLGKGVQIACHEVTPFQSGDDILLDIVQIIPTPQTADYVIKLAEKNASDDQASSHEAERHRRRFAYWSQLLERANERKITGLSRKSPTRDNWITVPCGIGGLHFGLVVKEQEIKADVVFETRSKELNKELFDVVHEHFEDIEPKINDNVEWHRKSDIKRSLIIVKKEVDGVDESNWPEMIDWQLDRLCELENALEPLIPTLAELARNG